MTTPARAPRRKTRISSAGSMVIRRAGGSRPLLNEPEALATGFASPSLTLPARSTWNRGLTPPARLHPFSNQRGDLLGPLVAGVHHQVGTLAIERLADTQQGGDLFRRSRGADR